MVSKKALSLVVVLLLCVALVAEQYAVPVWAEDESLLDATVTVTSSSPESYGASVAASSGVFLQGSALGQPDSWGAWMHRRGWISIELEDTVMDCSHVSLWLAKIGRRDPGFKVYISTDGSNWTYIGNDRCTTGSYTQYDFSGDFNEVKYIKIKRNGSGRWSWLLIDAVRAKGGDAHP